MSNEARVTKPGSAEEALPWMDAVFRLALRLARGREAEAEDLVQATLLRAIPHGNGFWFAWVAFRPNTEIWTAG